MQLTYPKAPANGAQVLRPALQAALQSKGFGVNRQFAQATASKVSLSEPYRGYSLSLEDLAQGKGLQQATLGTGITWCSATGYRLPTPNWRKSVARSSSRP